MKNVIKAFGIIALAAVIGFSMTACGGSTDDDNHIVPGEPGEPGSPGGTTPEAGQYSGKDVLGNSYSISVGSGVPMTSIAARYARAAVKKDDRFNMSVKGRDNKTRNVSGKVKSIGADGTLTLETDKGEELTATVSGSSLGSVVAGEGGITFDDGTVIIPRSFKNIYLRANRWSTASASGENWSSGLSVLVTDFPTNVSKLVKEDNDRFTITISGKSSINLDHFLINIHGITENNEWVWLANSSTYQEIKANQPFDKIITLNSFNWSDSLNFSAYKEIVMEIQNTLKYQDGNGNENYGTIPADIPDGESMAVISEFNIALKDKNRAAFKGNMSDYSYGYSEDGMSIEYNRAVWKLTPENIAAIKGGNPRFEFIMVGLEDNILNPPTCLWFLWQDPVHDLWWQDFGPITDYSEELDAEDGDEGTGWFLVDGVSWAGWQRKITLDLSKFIKDTRIYNATTELNFMVWCWYNGDDWPDHEPFENISDLGITGANVYKLPTCTGNLTNYRHGTKEDGISVDLSKVDWDLPEKVLETAQGDGAKLELVFSNSIEETNLVLTWSSYNASRWWPSETEGGKDWENLYIYKSGETINGVTYDSKNKKLTVVLADALETYHDSSADTGSIGFESAEDASFSLSCWGGASDITDLGIKSANIVK